MSENINIDCKRSHDFNKQDKIHIYVCWKAVGINVLTTITKLRTNS